MTGQEGANAGQEGAGTNAQQGQEEQGGQQTQQTQPPQLSNDSVLEYLKNNPDFTAKIVQPAVDSAISKHVAEKNDLKSQLEQYELSGKTELEQTKYKLEKEANARLELEKKINGMALANFQNEAVVDFGLSKEDLPLIAGNSVEEIKTKAEALQKRYAGIQEATKKDLLKNASGVPNSGGTAKGTNPFNDESWDSNAQLTLKKENPTLYAEMRAAAKSNPTNTKINL